MSAGRFRALGRRNICVDLKDRITFHPATTGDVNLPAIFAHIQQFALPESFPVERRASLGEWNRRLALENLRRTTAQTSGARPTVERLGPAVPVNDLVLRVPNKNRLAAQIEQPFVRKIFTHRRGRWRPLPQETSQGVSAVYTLGT